MRNSQFHVIFPKHNLNFSPVSLRNTQFHVISMGKHKHEMVQLVWKGLKLITKEKKQYIWRFSRNSTGGVLYKKYCIVSFWYFQFCTGSTGTAIKFWYDIFRYWFLTFKNWYNIFWFEITPFSISPMPGRPLAVAIWDGFPFSRIRSFLRKHDFNQN
jgi:hypothetical protein